MNQLIGWSNMFNIWELFNFIRFFYFFLFNSDHRSKWVSLGFLLWKFLSFNEQIWCRTNEDRSHCWTTMDQLKLISFHQCSSRRIGPKINNEIVTHFDIEIESTIFTNIININATTMRQADLNEFQLNSIVNEPFIF